MTMRMGSASMGSTIGGALAFIAVAAIAPWLPPWLVSLATIAFANALVVRGLIILWRTGLVPFGQALFYAVGAYAVALIGRYTPIRDVFVVVLAGAISAGIIAYLIGFLLARYREPARDDLVGADWIDRLAVLRGQQAAGRDRPERVVVDRRHQ